MSTNHTPTPWEAQDFCDGDEGFAIIGSNLGGLVAYAMMQPADIDNQDTSRAEANAEFIVAACNAYDPNQARIAELELALKVARALMLQEADLASRAGQMDRLEAGATRITAALEPKP